MKAQLLVFAQDHRQADDALAIGLRPAVKRRQGIKLTLDGPIGADGHFRAPEQPHPQHLLQLLGAQQAIDHGLALGLQLPAQQRLVTGRVEFEIHWPVTRFLVQT